jgi:lipid II:glycine glycyltransferase (peptidoglycan interpeptide bridge formation enzyme)
MTGLKLKIESNTDLCFLKTEALGLPVFCDIRFMLNTISLGQKLVYLNFYCEHEIIATIPLIEIQSKLLKSYSTPPLCPFTTIVLKPEYNNVSNISACLVQLQSKSFLKSIDKMNFSLDIPNHGAFLNYPTRLTHVIDLNQSEDEIFVNFRNDKKRNIKKQAKEGISISFNRNTDILVALIEMTYSRQNKTIAWKKSIENLSREYKNSYQITAYIDDEPVASLFFVYDSQKAYYLAGGFNSNVGNYNAGPIAMWEGIKHAKRLGLSQFDFEGSRVESIRNYFLSFGSVPLEFPVFNYQSQKFKLIQWLKKFR